MVNEYYLELEDDDNKLVLPSDKKKKSLPKIPNLKIYILLLLVVVLYFSYNHIIFFFLNLLSLNPTIYSHYIFIEDQILNSTLVGLLFLSILGSLFFLALPSEIIFIFYLSETQRNPIFVLLIMIVGNLVGLMINYFVGWLLGQNIVKFFFKKNFENYKSKVDDYGGFVLLLGNIFPGPIELLSVFYGAFKFPFRYYMFLSLVGRTLKYMLLFVMYLFFWDQLVFMYESFIENFLVLKDIFKLK